MCTCPFHSERNPSFGVKLEESGKGTYQCFTCQERGTVYELIRRLDGMDARIRPVLGKITQGAPQKLQARKQQGKESAKAFEEELLYEYNYQTDYWGERGIDINTIAKFKLGLNPQKWSIAIPMRSVYNPSDLSGVCFRYIDNHPNFPVEWKQQIVAGEIKRYHYLPGSIPGVSLFGVDAIRSYDEVYLFEGSIDAMNFMQREGKQALARWGTIISPYQADYLSKFERLNVVIDKDANRAGSVAGRQVRSVLKGKVIIQLLEMKESVKDYSEAVMKGLSTEMVFMSTKESA